MLEAVLQFLPYDWYHDSAINLLFILLSAIQGLVFQEDNGSKDSVMASSFHSGKVVFTLLIKIVVFHMLLTIIYI